MRKIYEGIYVFKLTLRLVNLVVALRELRTLFHADASVAATFVDGDSLCVKVEIKHTQ